jgi:hypothetical protein
MVKDEVIEAVDYLSRKFKRTLKDSRYRAKRKNIEHNIDFDYLRDLFKEQKAKCFYTGLNFVPGDKLRSMSLDRVDSNQGYVKGNVVWCLADINFLKFTRSYTKTIEICKKMVFHRPNWNLVKKGM